MPTYRAIQDSEVAVDAPVTQQLMQALRDNILAIQEGDTTAPSIAIAALASYTTTPAAGDNVIAMTGAYTSGNTHSRGFKIRVAGTYRVRLDVDYVTTATLGNNGTFTIARSTDSGGSYTTLVTVTDTGGDQDHTLSVDQACTAGDYIKFTLTPETSNANIQYIATISVADDNAIFGVQAIPLASLQLV